MKKWIFKCLKTAECNSSVRKSRYLTRLLSLMQHLALDVSLRIEPPVSFIQKSYYDGNWRMSFVCVAYFHICRSIDVLFPHQLRQPISESFQLYQISWVIFCPLDSTSWRLVFDCNTSNIISIGIFQHLLMNSSVAIRVGAALIWCPVGYWRKLVASCPLIL